MNNNIKILLTAAAIIILAGAVFALYTAGFFSAEAEHYDAEGILLVKDPSKAGYISSEEIKQRFPNADVEVIRDKDGVEYWKITEK